MKEQSNQASSEIVEAAAAVVDGKCKVLGSEQELKDFTLEKGYRKYVVTVPASDATPDSNDPTIVPGATYYVVARDTASSFQTVAEKLGWTTRVHGRGDASAKSEKKADDALASLDEETRKRLFEKYMGKSSESATPTEQQKQETIAASEQAGAQAARDILASDAAKSKKGKGKTAASK